MMRTKNKLLIFAAFCMIMLFALLPLLVFTLLDLQQESTPSYKEIASIELQLSENRYALTVPDKLGLLANAESANIKRDQMTMTEDEVYEVVEAFLAQLDSTGISLSLEPTEVILQPKLTYDLSDSSRNIAVWSVSFVSQKEPVKNLLLDIDDETGQILCICYNIYQSYEMQGVWARNKMVIDIITDLYFSQLGLTEVAETIEHTAATNPSYLSGYEYKDVDGGVSEAIYTFDSPLYGEFHVHFTADGAGGFMISFLK